MANCFVSFIQSVSLAPIALHINNKDNQGVRKVFNKNFLFMSVLGFVLVVGTYFYGRDILLIYGKGYVSGSNILIIFMAIQVVVLAGSLAVPTLLYLGKNIFVVSSSILLIVLLLAFISLFGYFFQEVGIAIGVLLAVVLVFVTQSLYAYKLTFESSQ